MCQSPITERPLKINKEIADARCSHCIILPQTYMGLMTITIGTCISWQPLLTISQNPFIRTQSEIGPTGFHVLVI